MLKSWAIRFESPHPLTDARILVLVIIFATRRTGTGAKRGARNFVFAVVTPDKAAEPEEEEEEKKAAKKNAKKQNKPPAAKKVKLDRTLKPESRVATIFNLL